MNENTYKDLLINLLESKEISLDKESITSLQNIFKPRLLKKDVFFYRKVKNLMK